MNWRKAESTIRPAELDTTSSRKFNYVRKNIVEEQRETEQGTITMYVYDELKVAKADWELFETVSDSAERIADVEDAVIELAELIGG